ncbi:PAS domain S-box-containing protein/diguanylate cyclase (GGDEF) domain-containing protein [Marinomonas polaris DSM 16579]|uniref:diguanylate cyclase n=1 Tax=Marinomonas polaris DSM 16579 TaxID=1122206 RepID=A0A1M5E9K6_9GAMM|nr:GGDEF domain-containing protein [Marinomonas polaris]SHF75928.1 PAS domain S-box-containing protein/diguanylate cyclase (GGDEF) domain-containing protein [Marinomonas polaris DSM 16579]
MTPSILYFSPQLASWKTQLDTLLLTCGQAVEWQAVQSIDQSPVLSVVLLAEKDIKASDWPLLASRKTIVIVDEWSLERSVTWIQRGAANCFARDDEHLAAWIISELSQFTLSRSHSDEDDVLQVIIDAIPVPIFFKDHLHIYRGCNTAFCQSLGFSREKVIGHSVYDVAPKHLADTYYEADRKLLAKGGTQCYEAEVRFSDGSLHEMEFNKAVFTKSNGQALGQVGVMLDVTERNQLIRQLDKATRTDPLTGTSNRREFNLIIHDEFNKRKHSEQTLSLMTLDVDFFKKINDRFGHGGGDQALQLIANWLQSQLRSSDTLFRVGGEEFYILMRDTDIQNALKTAERLCKGMATHTFLINQQSVHITLSAGVIELAPTTDLESALDMVDKALYEAKSDGRNCVCPVFQ